MQNVCNFGKRVSNSMVAMKSSPSIISLSYSTITSPGSKTDESNFSVGNPVSGDSAGKDFRSCPPKGILVGL